MDLKTARLNEKHSKLLEEINIKNSPYSEYNRVWVGTSNGRNVYTFGLVDENGVKIKRTVVPIYRYKIECLLGRKLTSNEIVHHIDGDMTNDSVDNLEVMDRSEHCKEHIGNGDYFGEGSLSTHYYNNGVKNIRLRDDEQVPDGFVRGRLISDSVRETYRNNMKIVRELRK